jgi:hypothetical protein
MNSLSGLFGLDRILGPTPRDEGAGVWHPWRRSVGPLAFLPTCPVQRPAKWQFWGN